MKRNVKMDLILCFCTLPLVHDSEMLKCLLPRISGSSCVILFGNSVINSAISGIDSFNSSDSWDLARRRWKE